MTQIPPNPLNPLKLKVGDIWVDKKYPTMMVLVISYNSIWSINVISFNYGGEKMYFDCQSTSWFQAWLTPLSEYLEDINS